MKTTYAWTRPGIFSPSAQPSECFAKISSLEAVNFVNFGGVSDIKRQGSWLRGPNSSQQKKINGFLELFRWDEIYPKQKIQKF